MLDPYQLSNFIWQIADLLRGPYRPPQYEKVILPLVVLRRFDCVLAPTKAKVLAEYERRKEMKEEAREPILNKVAGQNFHNHSKLDFERLKDDPNNIARHLTDYTHNFSRNIREIFERFEFADEIRKMDENNILFLIISKFCEIDLHPDHLDNIGMGLLFEDLIRRFNEAANETAGDHFTPREVIQLMVDLLFSPDDPILTAEGKIFKLLDPACGTGGMLTEAQKHLFEMNSQAQLYVYGQDFNPRSYAIAASDLLLKGNDKSRIAFGDSFTADAFIGETFDYLLANPPFGVDWKKQQSAIQLEHEKLGFKGRFGAGLPRVNDGALLFLQHMVSKFQPIQLSGSRMAIVFNGSPLFTGGAGSGESEIRKWLIENDWLEAIVALPEQMFYNTGIGTYLWILSNRKEAHRRGKIQLIDARERYQAMRRSLGNKRRELGANDITTIVTEYGDFAENPTSKIFDNADFGYNRVTIERPLRLLYTMSLEAKEAFLNAYPHLLADVQAIDHELGRTPREDWTEFDQLMLNLLKTRSSKWKKKELTDFRKTFTDTSADALPVIQSIQPAKAGFERVWGWFPYEKGKVVSYEADSALRDAENVDLKDEVARYVHAEVIPHVEDAWADRDSIKSAYEINFNRYFYSYKPPRPLHLIDAEIKTLEGEILQLLKEITE